MKLRICFLISAIAAISFMNAPSVSGQDSSSSLKIWFNRPADTWNDALPIGNGSLGAMVFGNVENERLEINEESVWTGGERWDANPDALKTLPKVRQLLFEGKYKEAEALAQKGILNYKPGNPAASYQALGDMYLKFGPQRGMSNYRRELDINEAIARVSYSAGTVNYMREVFSSAPGQALVVRLTADKPGAITFTLKLSRDGAKPEISSSGNDIIIH